MNLCESPDEPFKAFLPGKSRLGKPIDHRGNERLRADKCKAHVHFHGVDRPAAFQLAERLGIGQIILRGMAQGKRALERMHLCAIRAPHPFHQADRLLSAAIHHQKTVSVNQQEHMQVRLTAVILPADNQAVGAIGLLPLRRKHARLNAVSLIARRIEQRLNGCHGPDDRIPSGIQIVRDLHPAAAPPMQQAVCDGRADFPVAAADEGHGYGPAAGILLQLPVKCPAGAAVRALQINGPPGTLFIHIPKHLSHGLLLRYPSTPRRLTSSDSRSICCCAFVRDSQFPLTNR